MDQVAPADLGHGDEKSWRGGNSSGVACVVPGMGIFRRDRSRRNKRLGNGADFAGEAAGALVEAAPGMLAVAGRAIGRIVSGIVHALT